MRKAAHERASLLTPIAKAFSTDIGIEVASLGIQVHGGMGYIEETGAAQHYRDARIAAIYEGTNGIQAIDLVTRKLPLSGGATVKALIAELRHTVEAINVSNDAAFGWTSVRLEDALDSLERTTQWLLGQQQNDPDTLLAGATPYLRLFAVAAGMRHAGRGGARRDTDERRRGRGCAHRASRASSRRTSRSPRAGSSASCSRAPTA